MKIIKDIPTLEEFRKSTPSMALVPTMGALHAGHISLVEAGLKCADICMPYIYVNPAQFAEGEDLDHYPKTLEADIEKLEKAGAQALWLPSTQDIYPDGVKAHIKAGQSARPLEGLHRPHFFDGVVSVLHRMFTLSKPNKVMMGEKDFQQLQVVRHMVRDYKLPIEIIGCHTVRDKNGLALSSRNIYLSASEYESAAQLNQILVQLGQNMITACEGKRLLLDMGFDKIDYLCARNEDNFEAENPTRVFAAAWIGTTRLIDNMPMLNL